MTDPLSRVLAATPQGPNTNGLRIGEVVDGQITLQGAVLQNVGMLGGYAPAPGDRVALLQQDGMWLALGRIGGGGGAVNPFPVGAIFMSVDDTDPGLLFGGTWDPIEDRFLLAAGSTFTAGATGGQQNTTLVAANLPPHAHTGPSHIHSGPSHTHPIGGSTGGQSATHHHDVGWDNDGAAGVGRLTFHTAGVSGAGGTSPSGNASANHSHSLPANTGSGGTGNTGSAGAGNTGNGPGTSTAFTNMPPYLVVHVWVRIA